MQSYVSIKLTIVLYLALAAFFVYRVHAYCEGNLSSCSEKKEEKSDNRLSENDVFVNIRTEFTKIARAYLPSPHSELLLGMTIGIDDLKDVPNYKQMLKDTGTIHVVVVSGFNITLVFNFLLRIVGSKYRIGNLVICLLGTFVYSLLSGFEPPVVRAWLMGVLVSTGTYYGRSIDVISVLVATGLILVITNPYYLFSLSFQLSFIATLSLVLFSSNISGSISKLLHTKNVLVEDLSATLSAQILIWPLLSLKFGTVSLISPLVNALILWTVPLITTFGLMFLVIAKVFSPLGSILSYVVYFPLEIFSFAVEHFSMLSFSTVDYNIGGKGFFIYYLSIVLYLLFRRIRSRASHVQ